MLNGSRSSLRCSSQSHTDSTAPGDIRVRTVMLLGANEHISHHI